MKIQQNGHARPLKKTTLQHDRRKGQILDTASYLFAAKGYEQTSIQEIIDTLSIAKGTFYHYFKSKAELLEAVTGRMADAIFMALEEIVENKSMNAVEKLNAISARAEKIKLSQPDLIKAMLEFYTNSDHIVMVHMIQAKHLERAAPLMERVIRQGVSEGVFNNPYPELAARHLLFVAESSRQSLTVNALRAMRGEGGGEEIKIITAAVNDSICRILGTTTDVVTYFKTDLMDKLTRAGKREGNQ
ncbi:MAG: hypothetical protein CVV64_16040 [Candidatus Wallbacteria bacterium HGW-Wallbacteria-1]|jgi:AcrR family transcriptional regulator|uniref:HTH tetR-type domain-containing protein n=1 Tax=Candidatus Wallbacteria bacterium HGW-Wallbacteria-1 TaxID=2013854 RepID=A0A2N1PL37_9BACT|nr:MAG: hypothetical protein CVV64_16040 [Candidatus Wallbacteria bacterium HGW-Wallbacteria-1]